MAADLSDLMKIDDPGFYDPANATILARLPSEAAPLGATVFLKELLACSSSIEFASDPQRVSLPLRHGWHHLPLRFGTGTEESSG